MSMWSPGALRASKDVTAYPMMHYTNVPWGLRMFWHGWLDLYSFPENQKIKMLEQILELDIKCVVFAQGPDVLAYQRCSWRIWQYILPRPFSRDEMRIFFSNAADATLFRLGIEDV